MQSALEEGRAGEGDPLVVDGASPLRKQKQSQRKGKAKNKSKGKEEGDASSITLPVLNSHSRTGGPGSDTHDNGFSPKKGSSSSLRHSESKEQSPNPSRSPSSSGRKMHSPNKFDDEGDDSAKANLFPVSTPSRSPDTQRAEGGAGSGRDQQMSPQKPRPAVSTRSVGTDTGTDEPPLLPSPALAATTVVVPLEFDKEAAAAAVQRIPDLSNDALTAFCAPDWINIFSAMDDLVLVPVLVPGSRDRNKSTSRDRSRDDGASGSEGGAPAPASVSAVVGGAHMYVKGIILGQAPPSLDAQKLMFIADQPFP